MFLLDFMEGTFDLKINSIRGDVKKAVVLGGAPPPICGQTTTFLWEFFLLRIPRYGKIIEQI